MSQRLARRAIKRALGYFGYQVSRTASAARDPFDLQREFIATREPVILDVGAHVGAVTKRYRELFPKASIHCFEPYPASFALLREAVREDQRITCHQIALSDRTGVSAFHANVSPATNSLLSTDARGHFFWGNGLLNTREHLEVNTTTVDSFCLETGIGLVDILKLDVQGAEFAVLQGARRMLGSRAISLIYTELIMCPTYAGQHKLHEYLSLLDSAGYELLDFFNPVRRHRQLIQADAIFVSLASKESNELGILGS